ncbi:MAG: hypothetical protein HF314_13740 [Ignavibacteria bacterium]|jgi:hypothetical protein|nr:hypothetical protein [Ignavibacteria bacterium]MCU7504140.1 hypothetical protein [Ignavibacteria bacterium]MCU7516410.1 hypothetical protein [Ignavibacteria bacterium]
MNRLLVIGLMALLFSCRSFSQASASGTSSAQAAVDSLVSRLNENNKKSLKEFYNQIFAMDSLAEKPLLENMNKKSSVQKMSVLSHALVYVCKENILNELVHAYRRADDASARAMIVYTILGVRYKFNETSELELIPNKEIFPLLIGTLNDSLDISSIAEGVKKINGIAWLAIQKWGEFKDLKKAFSTDFMEASVEQKKKLQTKLQEWWKENGNNVYWNKKLKMFTLIGD